MYFQNFMEFFKLENVPGLIMQHLNVANNLQRSLLLIFDHVKFVKNILQKFVQITNFDVKGTLMFIVQCTYKTLTQDF